MLLNFVSESVQFPNWTTISSTTATVAFFGRLDRNSCQQHSSSNAAIPPRGGKILIKQL